MKTQYENAFLAGFIKAASMNQPGTVQPMIPPLGANNQTPGQMGQTATSQSVAPPAQPQQGQPQQQQQPQGEFYQLLAQIKAQSPTKPGQLPTAPVQTFYQQKIQPPQQPMQPQHMV